MSRPPLVQHQFKLVRRSPILLRPPKPTRAATPCMHTRREMLLITNVTLDDQVLSASLLERFLCPRPIPTYLRRRAIRHLLPRTAYLPIAKLLLSHTCPTLTIGARSLLEDCLALEPGARPSAAQLQGRVEELLQVRLGRAPGRSAVHGLSACCACTVNIQAVLASEDAFALHAALSCSPHLLDLLPTPHSGCLHDPTRQAAAGPELAYLLLGATRREVLR